jgi:hypothetical protein
VVLVVAATTKPTMPKRRGVRRWMQRSGRRSDDQLIQRERTAAKRYGGAVSTSLGSAVSGGGLT